jgi:hypothetical protein
MHYFFSGPTGKDSLPFELTIRAQFDAVGARAR